jgi:TonB-linked SusC/RagA family outer membrane protein
MQITAFCKKEPFSKLNRFADSHLIRVIKFITPEFTPALVIAINRAKPFRQVILKMKLTAVVLIIACLQVSASGFAQKITISRQNAPVEQVLKEIKKQSGYLFFYNQEWIKQVKAVDIDVKQASIDEVLKICFYNQPVNYSIVDKTIILSKNEGFIPNIEIPIQKEVPPKEVKGKVKDASGETLPGVNVRVKGTSTGTTTDVNGNYTITVPEDNSILVYTYIGYVTKEVAVSSRTAIDVTLDAANTALTEVVVIGYGTSNLANLTGSVSTVDVEKAMSSRPATNVASMLQGQASGVQIHANSGQPGAEGMNVLIRGQGSMGDSQPLVIVDGFESSMDNINPFDIESISILKDAASASIYGTRAANGVILVSTKRGKEGPIQIRYNTYFGKQDPTAVPDFLGSAEYAELHNEARANAGLSPTFTADAIARYRAGNDPNFPSTDWMSVLYSGSGGSQYHGLDFSGGTEATRYNISMAYNEQRGVIQNVDADQLNFRFNVDNKINKWLNVGINTALNRAVNTLPLTGPELTRGGDLQQFYNSVTHIPPTQKLRLADGSWSGEYPLGNFAAWIDQGNLRSVKANQLVGSIFSDAKIIKGLSWRNRASIDYTFRETNNHISRFVYGGGQVSGPSSNQEIVDRFGIIDMESLFSYDNRFGKHGVKGLAGASTRSEDFYSTMAFRLDFPSNDLQAISAGGTAGLLNAGTNRRSTLGSYFARVNYDYDGKYLFEANIRRDGSSKFARGNRWGWFPSFSAGWVMSDESFMKNINWLNFLKLRASWGQLGNHRIADFMYLPLISLGQNYAFGGASATGAAQTIANNPDITWETTTEKNIGMDLKLLKNRISVSIDAYDRYTDDILTVIPVSGTFGLPAPTVNYGAMRNTGIETEFRYSKMKGEFQFDVSVNGSYNKNNVEKYFSRDIFDVAGEGGAIVRERGIPWNSYIGYEWNGYFMSDAEARTGAVHHPSVGAGDLKFKDQNGDGKIDGNDRVVLGNTVPKFTYGMNLGFRFKGFDFSTFFHGVEDVSRYLRVRGFMPFMRNGKALRMHQDRMIVANGAVTKEGYFPKTLLEGGPGGKNVVASGFSIHDASYLRMKNIQLGYTIPASLSKKASISRARLYVSGENLLTFTKFPDGYDPEANNTAFHGHIFGGAAGWSYPQVKFYTVGLNVNF